MGEATMMTDRELLELAAKAAGYNVRWHEHWQCFVHVEPHNIESPPTMAGQRHVWIPLTDDGDALRLAVKLDISVFGYFPFDDVAAFDGRRIIETKQPDDPMPATRRAIVRAAAAIGEDMQ
jgi:hypothetical protein